MNDNERVLHEFAELTKALEQTDKEKKEAKAKLIVRLQKVTPDLFGKFLAEKNASHSCLSCGSNRLSVPESRTIPTPSPADRHSTKSTAEKKQWLIEQMTPYVTPTFNQPNNHPRLSAVDYRVSCQNCGHIMLYRASPVVEWVEWILENFGEIPNE